MSLSASERDIAEQIARAAGLEECPDCADTLVLADDGVSPAVGQWPSGAYVLCETCGWAWRPVTAEQWEAIDKEVDRVGREVFRTGAELAE